MQSNSLDVKLIYANYGISISIVVIFFSCFIPLAMIFPFVKEIIDSGPFGAFSLMLGWLALTIFSPFVLAGYPSHIVMTSSGITERRGYLLGLIKRDFQFHWSDVQAWDLDFMFSKKEKKTPQLKLYIGRRCVRIPGNNKNLRFNGEISSWDNFVAKFKEMMEANGVEQTIPNYVIRRSVMLMKALSIGIDVLGVLMVFAIVLALAAGRMPPQIVIAIVPYYVIRKVIKGLANNFLKTFDDKKNAVDDEK